MGLDLPDFAAAGEPLRVEAELFGAPSVAGVSVAVTVGAVDGPPVGVVALTRSAGARWVGEVPGLAPGLYACRVDAVGVPKVDQMRCGDVVAVVAA